MKKFPVIITLCLLLSSFTISCERALLNRIGKDVYYMQIKDEETIENVDDRNLRNYTLPAYDEDGVKKKQITFRSTKKENDHKLNENAFLRHYVDQDDNSKNEILSIEVKSYEEIQKADLPEKLKDKFTIK
ncbi:YxeA family protein [Bacillus cereus]|uniref:YxeA family protein n=1 Tax=Bacillus cereus TaxID=1396 RepID=UPI00107635E6|nr:YxeA family protein [Bacillus cereus]MDA2507117.1 YxeA family protein [Bacillus cereus]TFZ12058.1 cytoplasmic protein [Bacillus cereus]